MQNPPMPQMIPKVDPNAQPDASAQPTIEIKLKVSQNEVNDAIQVLKEAGMDSFAEILEKAMPKTDPNAMDPTSQGLQDDIVAMQPRG